MEEPALRRLIVGLSGASGSIYGIRLLDVLRSVKGVATHLIVSNGARRTIELETDYTVADVEGLADVVHAPGNLAAPVSSGSFKTAGMVVAPCAMKTLSGIVNSYSDNLVQRAADVVLKERRTLVLVPRETPLHLGHARLFVKAMEMGAVVMPPVPAFYQRPQTINDIVDQTVGRILDLFDIESEGAPVRRWAGA